MACPVPETILTKETSVFCMPGDILRIAPSRTGAGELRTVSEVRHDGLIQEREDPTEFYFPECYVFVSRPRMTYTDPTDDTLVQTVHRILPNLDAQAVHTLADAIRANLSHEAFAQTPQTPAPPSEPIGPETYSASGKFFLALDHLTRMTWRWGESCGIDDVGWDETGDSYNESCREAHRKAKRAAVEAFHAAIEESSASMRLDWLERNKNVDLSYKYEDPTEDGVWVVHRVNGGVNDREWTEIGRGPDPTTALTIAMKSGK